MEQGREKRKYLPKKKFYLTIEQLKQLDELKKQRSEIMTVDVERELKLYSPEASPLDWSGYRLCRHRFTFLALHRFFFNFQSFLFDISKIFYKAIRKIMTVSWQLRR